MGARILASSCLEQARRLQAVRATEEKTRQRLLGLADKACQDHDVQRIVAAALEGTFFNLIQVLDTCLLAGSHDRQGFAETAASQNLPPRYIHASVPYTKLYLVEFLG